MKDIFKNLLSTEGVEGLIYFDTGGQVLFKDLKPDLQSKFDDKTQTPDWPTFFQSLNKTQEADMIFANQRFYLRKTNTGFLFILLTISAQCAIIRLICEIMLPELNRLKKAKGLGRFFKKK